jgi:fatty-acyl-CoA synthase
MALMPPLFTPHTMSDRHFAHWPPSQPRHLTLPETSVFYNAEVSAARFPNKPFTVFYDSVITFAEFKAQAEHIAGFLQQRCNVKAGDRVLLYMQNSPQWMLAYHGILRANAVVVPVNPMNRTDELAHYVHDSGATTVILAQDLLAHVQPHLREGGLQHAIVTAYSDCLTAPTDLPLPEFVSAPRQPLSGPGLIAWHEVLAHALPPGPLTAGPDDLCVMPYTSGTTGQPKGCEHTHRSVMSTLVGGVQWFARTQDAVFLSVLPYFHVTGMIGGMHGPLFLGGTVVILPRWDRDAAARLIERYRIGSWQVISTMMIDFIANPRLADYDITSLNGVRGGGAAMPAAVAAKLRELTGLEYVEGYGMSETMAATHINPPHRPKPQCLGIPVFDVDARVLDPATLKELPTGEVGEIVVNAPQVMRGYWNNPQATKDAFIEIDGKRFLRTGDLAQVDEDGYFFMVDRLKRMINAAGYKVWPAEVEALMYQHPAIQEVCVIAAQDARRGETVKALVVLKADHQGTVTEAEIIAWAHEHMAAYKSPRIVTFVSSLLKSATGKVMWRELQDQEAKAAPQG